MVSHSFKVSTSVQYSGPESKFTFWCLWLEQNLKITLWIELNMDHKNLIPGDVYWRTVPSMPLL